MVQNSSDNVQNYDDDFDAIDNFEFSPPSSPVKSIAQTTNTNSVQVRFNDEMFATFFEMGFKVEMITKVIDELGPNADPAKIIETLTNYSKYDEASSSKSKIIDSFIEMGYSEEKVIKAIHEYGEENEEQILNALLSSDEVEKLTKVKEEENDVEIDWTDSDNDDVKVDNSVPFSDDMFSDDENDENQVRSLVRMGYSEIDATLAVERCGEGAELSDLVDIIGAAQMARGFSEFYTDPEQDKPRLGGKKRRTESRKEPRLSTDDDLIRLPIPMIGFGLPNEPGLITHRSLPQCVQGAPYFYYENVALAPKGVWDTISRHLYGIKPEFMDSRYICAANRKRGYVHNLPIEGRFMLQPPPKLTIFDAFPLTKRWWPSWDNRTKLNCLQTAMASAKLTGRIRDALERHNGVPPPEVQKWVIYQCKKWNLVWTGTNKTAPLEADEMESLLGFPRNHTRGGGISRTERFKSIGNSFQVDTVAYHLSVLKSMFPRGINVLSLFTGIGGGEVALHRLQIPMKTVVSVEISAVNRNILKDFWEQTSQKGTLIEFADVQDLTNERIEEMMEQFGGFDLVIGGSPCNNLAGSNRVTRSGLEGDESSLFFEYCRILDVVRDKTASMRSRSRF